MIFTGTGSAFNTKAGNTSAMIRKGNSLFLIDCGSSVFKVLKENHHLEGLKHLHVVITHTHADHCGSLGDLVLYCYYILKVRVHIHYPDTLAMGSYLSFVGAVPDTYWLHGADVYTIEDDELSGMQLTFHETRHIPGMISFGLLVRYDNITFYYSGDSTSLDDKILSMLSDNQLDYIFQDVSQSEGDLSVHMPFSKLEGLIPPPLRSKVICMHFDSETLPEEVQSKGFRAAIVNEKIFHC